MKLHFLSLVFISVALLFIPNDSLAQNQPSNKKYYHPEIGFELIGKDPHYDVFEYKPPELDGRRLPSEIRVASPVHFSNEKIIYWEHQNSSQYPSDGLSAPVQIKFQLTCASLYITKWKINSDEGEDQTDGIMGQDEASYMSYTVNPLPRDNEDPLAYNTADSETSGESDSPLLMYNVTELTINWFGPKFKSGFVDCAHGLKDKRKSRLYIFQRITDPHINPFVRQRQHTLEYAVDKVVPCTVHDPDRKPHLERHSHKLFTGYKDVEAEYSYNWRIGFTRKHSDPKFVPGTDYKCSLSNRYSLEYLIESTGSATSRSQKQKSKSENTNFASQVLKAKITRISEGPNNYINFVCSLNASSSANSVVITSIRVTPCISPYYCSSSKSEGGDSSVQKNCTDNEKEVNRCELKLTSQIGNTHIQGRITCGLVINRKPHKTRFFYFTGLSEKIYLLSYKPPPAEETFKISINRINSTTAKIRCESLKFFTFPSIKISITYNNKTTQLIRNDDRDRVTTTNNKLYFREILKSLRYGNDIDQVSCYAPPYDSSTWLHVSLYWPENYVLPTILQHTNGSGNSSSSSVGVGVGAHIWDEISTGVSKGSGKTTRFTTTCRHDNDLPANATAFSPPQIWKENSYDNDHTEELGLIYCHNQVALYSHINFNYTAIRQFNVLAEAWQYALRTYGPLGRTPHLHVVLHTNTPEDKCTTSNMDSYVDRVYGNRTVIDCGKRGGEWTSPKDIQILISQIGKLIFRIGKQTGNWPGSQVCQSEMGGILTYDIYMGIGRKLEASQWRRLKVTEKVDYPRENTHWFRDWFYPIYTEHGNSTVLNRFLTLLHEHWPRQINGYDYVNKLRLEEFVHFWSGAAGVNLRNLANKTFGWGEKNERKFMHAADEYFKIMYKDKMTSLSESVEIVAIQQTLNEPSPPVTIGMPVAFTIVIAVVFLCILVIGVLILIVIYRRKIGSLQDQIRELTNEEIQIFFEGNSKADKAASGYVFVESQPFNKNYEISRDRLDVSHDKVLGSGQFGLVLFGKLKNDPEVETAEYAPDSIVVAVKTVKPNVEVTDFMDMLLELKVMCYVGEHENIASVLGAVTANIKNREVYIALEFCAKGDLLAFLKEHRPHFKHLFCTKTRNTEWLASIIDTTTDPTTTATETTSFINDPADGTSDDEDISFSTLELLDWAHQISSGMEFISSRNVIHGDLAARNILLTENYIAKISDFGLSRQLHNYSTYMKKTKTPLPWKWMAIESLRDMQFSIQSDVWAFGVTLFEIFTLGTLPYPGQNWTLEFVDELVGGLRLKAPHFGNDEIFTLMMNCMKQMPKERIKFPQISQKLMDIKNEFQLQLQKLEADNNIGA